MKYISKMTPFNYSSLFNQIDIFFEKIILGKWKWILKVARNSKIFFKMKVEPATTNSDEMADASGSGFDSSDDDTGEVDLSPLEISW